MIDIINFFFLPFHLLPSGTDCQDCGPVGNDNFTRSDDDGWWDDDDDYWNFDDGNFVGGLRCCACFSSFL